ncbi:MAG TPA: antibiotic biosynthesis monooxygenase, partial [Mycobacterium sp.]|nr:antibiotic biosynthesis monooxygenase [Mycobacterium sp.]
SADLLEPGRINIFERWESVAAVEAFRGSGTSDEQGAAILAASVTEYDVGEIRSLT